MICAYQGKCQLKRSKEQRFFRLSFDIVMHDSAEWYTHVADASFTAIEKSVVIVFANAMQFSGFFLSHFDTKLGIYSNPVFPVAYPDLF